MYTYKFMTSVRVIPVSAVLSRVPYGSVFLHMPRIRVLHTLAGVRRRTLLYYAIVLSSTEIYDKSIHNSTYYR